MTESFNVSGHGLKIGEILIFEDGNQAIVGFRLASDKRSFALSNTGRLYNA